MLTTDSQAVRFPVDPRRTDLALEFRRARRPHYSLELQRVLYCMRWSGAGQRHVLVTMPPGRRWMLAQLPPRRGDPVITFPDQVFTRFADAEWAVFRLRWQSLTGHSLDTLHVD